LNQEQFKKIKVTLNSISQDNSEAVILLDYFIDFYQCNKFLLNKDGLIIYRHLIRACNGNLSQIMDNKESRETFFRRMKAHHHIMLLLGKPETDEEKEEYERYVEIQYGTGKNLDEMLGLRASDVIDGLGVVNNIEGKLLNEYYKIFYKDNGICLNKDELIIYRDLIRECKYHLSQSRDDEISEETFFRRMKSHHHIMLLLGKPETDEEKEEYARYVDIQYGSGKNLDEMLKLIDKDNQEKAIAEKEFLREASKKTGRELGKIYFRKI